MLSTNKIIAYLNRSRSQNNQSSFKLSKAKSRTEAAATSTTDRQNREQIERHSALLECSDSCHSISSFLELEADLPQEKLENFMLGQTVTKFHFSS